MSERGHLSNKNIQGLEEVKQQLQSLRRENRFLKIGLVFCLVLSAMPYLSGFQPETISAKRVVTERIEFVRDGKTVMSISLPLIGDGLVILGRDELPVIWIARDKDGGLIGTCNKDGKIGASMGVSPEGGGVGIYNNDGKIVVSMGVSPQGGVVTVRNNDSKPVARMGASPTGGGVGIYNNDGKPVVAIGVLGKDGKIYVFNNDGKLVWSSP